MDYINQFRQLFEQLNNNSSILVKHQRNKLKQYSDFHIDMGIKSTETLTGYTLPAFLRAFYSISSGTAIHWWYKMNGEERPGGEFDLVPLATVWGKAGKTGIPKDYLTPEQVHLLPSLSIIDQRPISGDGLFSAIKVPEGNEIYFHDTGKVFKMSLDYKGYLDALLDLKGYGGWQLLFCDGDLRESIRFKLDFLDRFSTYIENMKQIFPETKYDAYEDRIKKLKEEYT